MATNTAPRSGDGTVTVRVRTLLIAAAMLAVVAALVVFVHWGTSMQPLRPASFGTGPTGGLRPQPHTQDRFDHGPAVWRWSKGGGYVVAFGVENTASVPITITGVDDAIERPNSSALFTGPTLAIPSASLDITGLKSFRPFTIPAGSSRELALVFAVNPGACADATSRAEAQTSTQIVDSVKLQFTALGGFDNTQWLNFQDAAFILSSPTTSACAV